MSALPIFLYLQSIIAPLHAATEQLGITKKEKKRKKTPPVLGQGRFMHAARELETRKKNIPTSKSTTRNRKQCTHENAYKKVTSHD